MGKQVRAFWGGGGGGSGVGGWFFSMIFLEENGGAIIASVHLGALLLVDCNQICPSTALFLLRDVFHCGWLQRHHLDVFSIRTGRQKSPKDVETPNNNDLIVNVFQLPVKTQLLMQRSLQRPPLYMQPLMWGSQTLLWRTPVSESEASEWKRRSGRRH